MPMKRISIDTTRALGGIRPLNGVGGGPVTSHFTYDATDAFHDAGIPYGRTHDIEYPFGSGEFVDVHCIFPCFDADDSDPNAYNFTLTDEYLRMMREAGTEPFYRLGVTIEHQPIKRHIHPPKDFDKWASICSHIVAHYNDGWANGYHWDIKYWEIWNEPDIPQCWTGTREEIFELYRVASCLLRREHPDIKIGGLALTSPNSPMFEPFLAYARDHELPLDFVSWHGYCHTPAQAVALAERARSLMDQYGFTSAESIYDEWNYVIDWLDLKPSVDLHPTAFCAAFMAAVISSMQSSSVDKLMFYDAQLLMSDWNNLFTPKPMKAHAAMRGVNRLKGYWTLYAWNELRKAGRQVALTADEDIYATAAVSEDGETLIYLSYYNDEAGLNTAPPEDADILVEIDGAQAGDMTVYMVDDAHDFDARHISGGRFPMPGNTFALIRIAK